MNNHWRQLPTQTKSLILFSIIFLFRAYFSLHVGLIDDEAYHWSWAQDLQLSYFDHPAFVAWMNYLSTFLFGNTYLGVRLPAFIFYTLTIFFGWKLARDLFNEYAAHFFALNALWSPFWGFGGYVSSPEPYFMFFWVFSAWIFYQGVREDGLGWRPKQTWISLGITFGLGLNSKFITVLLAAGMGLYLLFSKKQRQVLFTPWPWVGAGIATLICSPIFIWNYIHDWPSFKYQFHSRHAHQELSLFRWFQFLLSQIAFYTPFLFALILIAYAWSVVNFRKVQWRFLFSLTTPALVIFYFQPLFADYKPHWSGASLFLLLAGAGGIFSSGLSWGERTIIKPMSSFWKTGILVFIIPINLFLYTPFVYPWMPKVYKFVNPKGEWNPRYDLSNEFFGWEDLGRHLIRRQRELHMEFGKKPFFASHRYETTAQTYWGTKQKTYQLSNDVSHYSVTQRFNGINYLLGENALFVMTEKYNDNPMEFAQFDDCSKEEFKTFRSGELSRIFYIYFCKNFQAILR